MKKSAELKFKGKPAKIEKSKTGSGFYVLYVKTPSGKWVRENISKSKRHLEGICKYS